ncbi:hypothetical protein [Pseudomonas sp. NPDC089569]|uniref:hypothetical protein n=1 Tax=Pseudomonas sp. NPDC089569 TaxID=3390722 RepID=UPI003D02EBA7
MTTFNIYFNGTCIDALENSTARKARNYVNRTYKKPEQCVVVGADVDQSEAIARSKMLHVVDPAFKAECAEVLSDEQLTTAARKRSGETVCFSNKDAGPTHGVVVLTTDLKWVTLLEGVTREEAREFMSNFNGRPEHVPAKVIKTKIGIVAGFNRAHQIVQTTDCQGYEKRFVNAKAAQKFINTYGDAGYGLTVADCEIVDFSYDLFSE